MSRAELEFLSRLPALARIAGVVVWLLVAWPIGVLVLSTTHEMDHAFVRLARLRKRWRALAKACAVIVLWVGGVVALGAAFSGVTPLGETEIVLLTWIALLILVAVSDQALKIYYTGVLARRRFEMVTRAAFVACLTTACVVTVYGRQRDDATTSNVRLSLGTPETAPPPAQSVVQAEVGREASGVFGGTSVWFSFTAREGAYRIEARANGDAFMRIYQAEPFRFLQENDDGSSRDALGSGVTVNLEAAQYLIEVRDLMAVPSTVSVTVRESGRTD